MKYLLVYIPDGDVESANEISDEHRESVDNGDLMIFQAANGKFEQLEVTGNPDEQGDIESWDDDWKVV